MKIQFNWLMLSFLLTTTFSSAVWSEDIDIFAGTREADPSLPNIVFVLDNTSNWSRQSQQWPGGLTQGQSEVRAIQTTFAELNNQVNVGIMEYNTGGSSSDNEAGFVRFHLQELNETSHTVFDGHLQTIFDNINSTTEKRGSSNPYGDLPWDFYNYLSGIDHSNNGAGTPSSIADSDGYTSEYDVFNSPLGSLDICADTYLIFIGNNVDGSIATDDTTNSNALRAAYSAAGKTAPDALAGDNSGDPLVLFDFEVEERTVGDEIIPGECEPDTVVPAYTREAYCEDDVVIPEEIIPEQVEPSQGCWKTTEAAACTVDENASGFCVGETGCACTSLASSHPGCLTTGRPSNRTYRWNVVIPEEVIEEQLIEGACFPEEEIPEQIIPGECTEDTVIPGGTFEVFVPGSGTDTSTSGDYNFDDWAKFLYNVGTPFETTVDSVTYSENVRVKTYVIDVFNRQQNEDLSKVWFNAANAGGGRYFQANSEDEIVAALNSIVGDIIAKESSFAAVSLPLSTTNRARVDNQLYIGMFRPSLGKEPRWWGNLKRYQLALFNSIPRIADVNLQEAINSASGFPKECAESFWTTDSGTYWENLGIDPPVEGECNDIDVAESPWSDLPDGKFVEKGGSAQQLREGPAGDSRNILTVADDTNLRDLATTDAAAMGGDDVYDYFIGDEAGSDGEVMPASGLRASLHGDVVHASPLAFRHAADSVTVYLGTNGGEYRAINAMDGTERWSLVAPEHFGKIERLYDNYPLVQYTGADEEVGFEHDPKDYFFDGSTGVLSGYEDDGTLIYAYIYPTQRRGGRMVYALDITDPDADPDLLWRKGCPNLDNDTGCSTGFSNIGQTWGKPVGGYVAGYVDLDDNPQQIVAFGGGFDDCLNADVATYPVACNSVKGRGVYILDALTGELLAHLDTDAPVITELAPIDIDFDDQLDYLYAADVEGNLYRVNFISQSGSNPGVGVTLLADDEWTIEKVAYESDPERRFYNAPVAGAFQGTVVVTIGSGDRERPLEVNYPFDDEVQNRFYAFFDEPWKTIVDDDVDLGVDEAHVVDLDGGTMLEVVADPDEDQAALATYDGWYMDLADRGEQVANASAIAGGKVFFNSFQPGGSTEGLCSEPLGIGTGYALDLFGPEFTEGNEITAPGLPIPPVIATVKVPPGQPPCDGEDCDEVPEDPCDQPDNECEVVTVCIGCEGFEPVEVVPNAPPIRQRVFFTEDIDRDGSN